jgi:four helix bundle protein
MNSSGYSAAPQRLISNFKFQIPQPIPTYQRFEDLPVWREAIELAEKCEDYIEAAKNHITWSKRDQLDRASLSVSNNIAEGFERGTTNELLAFLYIARGSAGEVRSMLCFFERRPKLRDFKSQISNLKLVAERCSRQLRAWADSLQNSDIAGPRHLNDQSRANYQKRKSREAGAAAFQQLLAQHLPPDHPLRAGKSQI